MNSRTSTYCRRTIENFKLLVLEDEFLPKNLSSPGCVAHNTRARSSKVKVILRGQLKIPVRSVTSADIEVY